MDFTLKKYEQLCNAIKQNYKTYSVKEFIEKKPKNGVVLRHDIDRKLRNALRIAKLEKKLNLKSTYYFRYPNTYDKKIIDKIYSLGHEIGYHYEVLDKSKGNYKKAVKLFKKELKHFEQWNVKTIAMHGNPLKDWSNRDLWLEYNFEDFGIIGEAYLSIDPDKLVYFTDTGRRWNDIRFNKKDHFNKTMVKVEDTNNLIELIMAKKFKTCYISTHPERWSDNFVEWWYNLIWQEIKNTGKIILR
jgi:hypothetical protein